MTTPFSIPSVQRARSLVRPSRAPSTSVLSLSRLSGRLIEVSEFGAYGALSALGDLMAEVQARGEAIAWVEAGNTVFYPPDLAARGLDVEALVVVWAPDAVAALQGSEWLLRSGAFGLVLVDGVASEVEASVLGRLARVAEDRESIALFLTRKRDTDPSLGPLVSLRVDVSRLPSGETQLRVLKDKHAGAAGYADTERMVFDGPLGLY